MSSSKNPDGFCSGGASPPVLDIDRRCYSHGSISRPVFIFHMTGHRPVVTYLATLRMRRPILAFGEIARVDIFKFKSTVAFRHDRTDWKKCGREIGRGFDRVGFKWNA